MPTVGATVDSTVKPWFVNQRIDSRGAREALAALLTPQAGGSTLKYRPGVFAAGDNGQPGSARTHTGMIVRPAGGMKVSVEKGSGVIPTDNNGPYIVTLADLSPVDLVNSAPSSNRIDVIIGRVYDDQNGAIGSGSGDRRYAVQAWTGDATSGTPVLQLPNLAAGWMPLAAVRVNAGASAITAADITDLRGTALPARGGKRVLYGPDAVVGSTAFAEAGSYPGEGRWVQGVTFPDQVYYGSAGGWRGVFNAVIRNGQPPLGDTLWTRGLDSTTELCRVTIPNLGVPYLIYASARCYIKVSGDTAVDCRINIGSTNGSAVNWVRTDNYGQVTDRQKVPNIAPVTYGPFTAQTDVVLSGAVRDCPNANAGFSFAGNEVGGTYLNVWAIPEPAPPGLT